MFELVFIAMTPVIAYIWLRSDRKGKKEMGWIGPLSIAIVILGIVGLILGLVS